MSELTRSALINLEGARDHLAQGKARYESAKVNFERARKLYEAVVLSEVNIKIGKSSLQLCELCDKIDFQSLFGRGGRRRKIRPITRRGVGNLFNAVENQSSCSCCRFLLEACQLGTASGQLRLHRYGEVRDSTIYLCDDAEEKPWYAKAGIAAELERPQTLWLQVGSSSESGEPYICISLESPNIEPGGRLDSSHRSLPRIRGTLEAFNGSINMDLVHQWITTCNGHGAGCRGSPRQDYIFYLIDVATRQIVRASGIGRYIALSYVWGKNAQNSYQREWSKEDADSLDDSLTEWRVPYPAAQTIEDAMTFVRNLGERYLWADLYCIDQEDESAKQEQIMHMDMIYTSAYLTIVALDGETAYWGLPGVSRPLEDTKQPTLRLSIGRITATYVFSIYHHLGKSVWDSRAWTLQERLLSCRCIVFAKNSISMRCEKQVFHDLLRLDDTGQFCGVLTRLGDEQYWEDGSTINLNETEWDYKHYDAFVSTSSGRNLTNQLDALNACRGVLSMITRNTGRKFVFGMPIEDFHRALLWKPHHENTVRRRQGFPSWSWVGWVGRTEYAYFIGDMADYLVDDDQPPKKRRQGQVVSDFSQEISADILVLPQSEADGDLIRLASDVATFHICRQRVDGELHLGLGPSSIQPQYAVGDHWTLVVAGGGATTHMLRDTAGEHEVFEPTDHFFRMHPDYRTTLDAHEFGHGRLPAEFLLIQRWPYIRDSKSSGRTRQNMVSAILIDRHEDGTYERLASILVPWQEWERGKPRRQTVQLR